jgi:hypothetical protein
MALLVVLISMLFMWIDALSCAHTTTKFIPASIFESSSGSCPTGVELPPLSEFLPPLDSINLPPLNEFLKKVGLPSWEEMNLPPLSEFMKPVFDPQVRWVARVLQEYHYISI